MGDIEMASNRQLKDVNILDADIEADIDPNSDVRTHAQPARNTMDSEAKPMNTLDEKTKDLCVKESNIWPENAHKINFALLLLNCIVQGWEVIAAWAVWNIYGTTEAETILKQYLFFKIITSLLVIWGWIETFRLREVCHIMTKIPVFVMLLLVEIPLLAYEPPSDSTQIHFFVATILIIDLVLISANVIVIYIARRIAQKIFNTDYKWNKFLNQYTKSVLSYLPVTDDMANEFTEDAKEAEMEDAANLADQENERHHR